MTCEGSADFRRDEIHAGCSLLFQIDGGSPQRDDHSRTPPASTNEKSTPRIGRTASATKKTGFLPTPAVMARPTAQATPIMTSCAAMMQALSEIVSVPGCFCASNLARRRQPCGVAEVEQHDGREEDREVAPASTARCDERPLPLQAAHHETGRNPETGGGDAARRRGDAEARSLGCIVSLERSTVARRRKLAFC